MEKETLEEAVKSYCEKEYSTPKPLGICIDFAKLGAKWQSETMYSEEEVKRLAFDFYYDMSHKMGVNTNQISENATNVDIWFEQLKKKEL